MRYLDVALQGDIDFIVSTVKLENREFKVPVLYIENVFSDDFVNEVHQVFQEKEEREKIFRATLRRDSFFRIEAESPENAIRALGEKMKKKRPD